MQKDLQKLKKNKKQGTTTVVSFFVAKETRYVKIMVESKIKTKTEGFL